MRLTDKHNIKEKLYSEDFLDKICILLRDARIIRWSRKLRKKEVEEERQRKMPIEILEKEAGLHQKIGLIQQTNFKITTK